MNSELRAYLKLIERERASRRAEAMLADEIRRLRQGLWDVVGKLGFDRDGDPTPDALVYPDLVDLALGVAKDVREELAEL